jgi:glucuronosyltransferase
MPLFAEQEGNVGAIVKEGWAIKVSMEDLDEKTLEAAIVEIIKNPKYTQVVKKHSILAKDRPLNAQETAAFWIEYVIRHHGAPHLHYPGADQNFLQKNSIDVIAFILVVLYVIIKLLKLLGKKLIRMCCKSSNEKVKKQ